MKPRRNRGGCARSLEVNRCSELLDLDVERLGKVYSHERDRPAAGSRRGCSIGGPPGVKTFPVDHRTRGEPIVSALRALSSTGELLGQAPTALPSNSATVKSITNTGSTGHARSSRLRQPGSAVSRRSTGRCGEFAGEQASGRCQVINRQASQFEVGGAPAVAVCRARATPAAPSSSPRSPARGRSIDSARRSALRSP